MVVTMGQQYNVGKKPTVILYTYINRHAGPPNITKQKTTEYILIVKAALYTMVPRSPFFAFCTTKVIPGIKCGLNICFNEMALFGPFAAFIKDCSSHGRNGGQPTRENN